MNQNFLQSRPKRSLNARANYTANTRNFTSSCGISIDKTPPPWGVATASPTRLSFVPRSSLPHYAATTSNLSRWYGSAMGAGYAAYSVDLDKVSGVVGSQDDALLRKVAKQSAECIKAADD